MHCNNCAIDRGLFSSIETELLECEKMFRFTRILNILHSECLFVIDNRVSSTENDLPVRAASIVRCQYTLRLRLLSKNDSSQLRTPNEKRKQAATILISNVLHDNRFRKWPAQQTVR